MRKTETRHRRVSGIILTCKPFGERGKLLKIFTAEHGKIFVRARGARTLTSPFIGLLQPFHAGTFHLYRSTAGHYTLTGCTIRHRFAALHQDFHRYRSAGKFLKMIDGHFFDEESPSTKVFRIIFDSLKTFEKTDVLPKTFHAAEKAILKELGLLGKILTNAAPLSSPPRRL